jgi:hypothetical protein
METRDALLAQLKELNERSRTYARQFWQLPFAYVATSAVVLAQLAEKKAVTIRIALAAVAVTGIFTVWHLAGVYRAAARCFCAMQDIEKRLELPPDHTKWAPSHLWALLVLPGAVVLVAAYLLACLR